MITAIRDFNLDVEVQCAGYRGAYFFDTQPFWCAVGIINGSNE